MMGNQTKNESADIAAVFDVNLMARVRDVSMRDRESSYVLVGPSTSIRQRWRWWPKTMITCASSTVYEQRQRAPSSSMGTVATVVTFYGGFSRILWSRYLYLYYNQHTDHPAPRGFIFAVGVPRTIPYHTIRRVLPYHTWCPTVPCLMSYHTIPGVGIICTYSKPTIITVRQIAIRRDNRATSNEKPEVAVSGRGRQLVQVSHLILLILYSWTACRPLALTAGSCVYVESNEKPEVAASGRTPTRSIISSYYTDMI